MCNQHPEFVARDTGVRKQRLVAAKGVEIGAADPDAADRDQDLAMARLGRGRGLAALPHIGFLQNNGLHGAEGHCWGALRCCAGGETAGK